MQMSAHLGESIYIFNSALEIDILLSVRLHESTVPIYKTLARHSVEDSWEINI